MHDFVEVHVVQRLADAAGDFHRVRLGQRMDLAQEGRQRLALQIFHHDVGAALLLRRHGENPQDVGMGQGRADFLLALEAGVGGRDRSQIASAATLMATVRPVLRSLALKMQAMPLRLIRSVISNRLSSSLAGLNFVAHGGCWWLLRSKARRDKNGAVRFH